MYNNQTIWRITKNLYYNNDWWIIFLNKFLKYFLKSFNKKPYEGKKKKQKKYLWEI